MFDSLQAYFLDVGSLLLGIPFNVTEKFFYLHLLTFVALAYLSYWLYYRNKRTRKGFLKFLFPKKIYWHQSARIDYGVFLINVALSPIILVGIGLQTWLSIEIAQYLVALNDDSAVFAADWSTATYALFILGYTMAADLAVYILHRLHHQSPILWPFHSLHHSAEVLTPVTLFRKHPVWNLFAHLIHQLFTGVFQGLFVFVFFGSPQFELLFGINTLYVVYNFCGANLRHSHVWLHWGKPLSYVFISPAMHQIHHDPKRMFKNYGEVFAIWDWMFGTLYIPKDVEQFAIGLGEEENPHATLASAYTRPFFDAWQALMKTVKRVPD